MLHTGLSFLELPSSSHLIFPMPLLQDDNDEEEDSVYIQVQLVSDVWWLISEPHKFTPGTALWAPRK